LSDRVIVRHKVNEIEDYLHAADLALYVSEMESFCLSILEAMCFAVPSVATEVGGIPEVVENNTTGILVPFGDVSGLAQAIQDLIASPARRMEMGAAGSDRARRHFSAAAIVPRYESLYRRVHASGR
jgi:L-malate glycosyltransferase